MAEAELVDRRDSGDPLPNPVRGCGTLKPGKAYLVGGGFSPLGVLPTWVACDPPVPFREIGTEGEFTRSYRKIDGLTLQLALEELTEFVPHYPDEVRKGKAREDLHESAAKNHVVAGVYDDIEGVPEAEVDRHIGRIRARGTEGGTHWGDIPVAESTDLLQRCGVSYYPEPEDYTEEAIRHGLSKAIPVSKGNVPAVVGGITRCWIMHPAACAGYGGGIIGYAYLSEVAFTRPEEGEVPAYVEEAAEAGQLAVRDIEPPEEPEEASPDATIGDFEDE